jgi:nitroreductase
MADDAPPIAARDVLQYLLSRYSVGPKHLREPAPGAQELRTAALAALRAPDHKHLVPFRFATIAAEQRPALAALFEAAALRAGHDAGEARKEARRAWNGPALLAFVARIDPANPEVPAHEQWVCAGGALANFVNALHLMGYGAKVLSGHKVSDPGVSGAFCGPGETLVGWVVAGTPDAMAHSRVEDEPDAVLGPWRQP